MKGNFPWGGSAATPIRIQIIIVEKHQISRRWEEEIALIKKEMANVIAFHLEVAIPHLERAIMDLQDKLERNKVQNYFNKCTGTSKKISLGKKGIAFCKSKVYRAATKFKVSLTGSGYEECLNFEENAEVGDKDDEDYDDDRSDSRHR